MKRVDALSDFLDTRQEHENSSFFLRLIDNMVDSSRYQLSVQVRENARASGWESYRVIHTVRAIDCLNGRRTSFIKTYIEILFSIGKQIFFILLLSVSIRRRVITNKVDEVLEVPVISFVSSLVQSIPENSSPTYPLPGA